MPDSESSQLDIVETSSYSSGDEPLQVGVPSPPPPRSPVPAPRRRLLIIEIPASPEEQSPEEDLNPAVPKSDRKPSGKPEVPYGRKLLFYFLFEFIRICCSLFNVFFMTEERDTQPSDIVKTPS